MCSINEPEYFFSAKSSIELAKKLKPDDVIEKALNQLYADRKIDAATQKLLHNILYQPLKEATQEGFGKPLFKIEYGTPNYEMLKNLQVNTAVFAMFKNHAMMQEMAGLLKDENGNLRSRDAFKTEALKVDSKYREQYLNTEYDTGVRTSRMAAIWAKAQTTKRLYPNLKYMPSLSAHQRDEHIKYYGIIRPIDDPFWNTHYPPNGWNCKCSVEPNDDDVTDVPANLPSPDKGFDFNSGKLGQVFDLKDSNYIKSVPPAQQPALIRKAAKLVDKEIAATIPYQQMFSTKNGGSVEAHPLSFDTLDFNKNMASCRLLANDGHQVKLLPSITDPALRPLLLPVKEIKGVTNPDVVINDDFVADLKVLETSSKSVLKHVLDESRKQCQNCVIIIPKSNTLSEFEVRQQIEAKCKFPEMQDFGNIWVNYKGTWLYNPQNK